MYELHVDQYELPMAWVYRKKLPHAKATFEVSTRRLPEGWSYAVAAGLELVLDYLEKLQFSTSQAEFIASRIHLRDKDKRDFIDFIESFKFHGDVVAMPEGSVFFPHEPILRITAPIAEAQIVETVVLSILNGSTFAASKAARCVEAAR